VHVLAAARRSCRHTAPRDCAAPHPTCVLL
jgi:hypothetical protein